MSNESPTIQELADVVEEMNDTLSETIYNNAGKYSNKYELFDGQPLCELVTNGDTTYIKLLGFYVWTSEDDERAYLNVIDVYGEETPLLNEDGGEARTPMKAWLMAQVRGVHSLVGEFLNGKGEE